MENKQEKTTTYLNRAVTRRQAIKFGGIAAVGLAFSKPLIETIMPKPAFADYVVSSGQGCTPGYWKQSQHFDSWTLPYTPTTPFSDVFENAFPGKDLLDVLGQGGGGLIALGRHTVAALLNAASGDVNYDLITTGQVISLFNGVFPGTDAAYESLKDMFAGFNEQGCPLN